MAPAAEGPAVGPAGPAFPEGTRVFVDTSGWYDYVAGAGPDHEAVAAVLDDERYPLVTSSYVFDETTTLVRRRLGHEAAVAVGNRLRDPSVVRIVPVDGDAVDAAWERFRDRPGMGYSFTDCTSFVLMERLGLEVAVATDGDFEKEGFTAVPG